MVPMHAHSLMRWVPAVFGHQGMIYKECVARDVRTVELLQ